MTIGLCFLIGGWFSTLVSENNGIFVFFRVKQKIIKATAKVILKDLIIIIIYLFVFFFFFFFFLGGGDIGVFVNVGQKNPIQGAGVE